MTNAIFAFLLHNQKGYCPLLSTTLPSLRSIRYSIGHATNAMLPSLLDAASWSPRVILNALIWSFFGTEVMFSIGSPVSFMDKQRSGKREQHRVPTAA